MNRPTTPYRLPDGRIVGIFEDVARGEPFILFELAAVPPATRGEIVTAVRLKFLTDQPIKSS